MELFSHLTENGGVPRAAMPPPGFGPPVVAHAWAIESSQISQSGNSGPDVPHQRRSYALDQLIRMRSFPSCRGERARKMGIAGALGSCFSPEVEAFWTSRLRDGLFVQTPPLVDTQIQQCSSESQSTATINYQSSPTLARAARADRTRNDDHLKVPELVPLDQSWLKPHPLLDGALGEPLEPDGGSLEAPGGGSIDISSSPVQSVPRRERGEDFVRPGFEDKVQAINARRASPPPGIGRASPSPLIDRRASPLQFADDGSKGEVVRYAKGPSTTGGFTVRIARRQKIASGLDSAKNPEEISLPFAPGSGSMPHRDGFGSVLSERTEGPPPLPIPTPFIFSETQVLNGMIPIRGSQDVHGIGDGIPMTRPHNASEQVATETLGESSSRAFGRWFVQSDEKHEPLVAAQQVGLLTENSDNNATNSGSSDDSSSLAPNVLSFFNAVKAQASSAGPRDEKRLKNVDSRTEISALTSPADSASALEVGTSKSAILAAPPPGTQQASSDDRDTRNAGAAPLYDLPPLASVEPSGHPGASAGQRFSAEQFFGMFAGATPEQVQVPDSSSHGPPVHMMQNLELQGNDRFPLMMHQSDPSRGVHLEHHHTQANGFGAPAASPTNPAIQISSMGSPEHPHLGTHPREQAGFGMNIFGDGDGTPRIPLPGGPSAALENPGTAGREVAPHEELLNPGAKHLTVMLPGNGIQANVPSGFPPGIPAPNMHPEIHGSRESAFGLPPAMNQAVPPSLAPSQNFPLLHQPGAPPSYPWQPQAGPPLLSPGHAHPTERVSAFPVGDPHVQHAPRDPSTW